MKSKKRTLSEETKKKISVSLKKYNKRKIYLQRKENRLKKITDTSKKSTSDLIPQSSVRAITGSIVQGRPTKYNKNFPIKILILMASGRPKETAAVLLGINPFTFWDWQKKEDNEGNLNPRYKEDFSKAVKAGEELQKAWWDEIGIKNLYNKDFNNTLYMMFRQNMHGWSRRLDGKIDINETHKEIKEVIFKFETDEIKSYIGELVELGVGVIEAPAEVH